MYDDVTLYVWVASVFDCVSLLCLSSSFCMYVVCSLISSSFRMLYVPSSALHFVCSLISSVFCMCSHEVSMLYVVSSLISSSFRMLYVPSSVLDLACGKFPQFVVVCSVKYVCMFCQVCLYVLRNLFTVRDFQGKSCNVFQGK